MILVQYGEMLLNARPSEIRINPNRVIKTKHMIKTNKNIDIDHGMSETVIAGTFLVKSEDDKRAIEDHVYTGDKKELRIGDRFYKEVKVLSMDFELLTLDGNIQEVPITFIALDPMPYDAATREAIY